MQRTDRRGSVWAQGVADGDNAEDFAFAAVMRAVANDNDGVTTALDLGETTFHVLIADTEFVGETMITDKMGMPVDDSLCSSTAAILVIFGSGEGDFLRLGVLNDRFGQRVR
jgi:hypothetical protein